MLRFLFHQDFGFSTSAIWGLVYKFTCMRYRSLDRIFDIVYPPVISLLLWGFTRPLLPQSPRFLE